MTDFITQQIAFYLAAALVLFLPGFLLLRTIWGQQVFSALESFVLSFALSIVAVDWIMLLMDRLSIPLTRWSLISGIGLSILVLFAIHLLRSSGKAPDSDSTMILSKRQIIVVGILLLLTIVIKTLYLSNNILPTSTDLGHHMYWSQTIVDEHRLPIYEKQDIEQQDGRYFIGAAEPISDFIIGEHTIFAAIALVSGTDLISAFPILMLYLIDMMSLLAVFILVLRAFQSSPLGSNVALFALGILGPLYAISPPQAQYVSGGVIGNIIGNLLFPLILYCLLRTFKELRSDFLAVGILLAGGLFYTHHLTSYLFLYLFAFAVLIFICLNFRSLRSFFRDWKKLLFAPSVLIVLACLILFLLFVYTPSYLSNGAVATVARAPTKTTREGMSFSELVSFIGSARLGLGLFGIWLLVFYRKHIRYASVLLLAWVISILLMLLWPAWLRVDIPTIRIANYFTFPISILGAITLTYLLAIIRSQLPGRSTIFSKRLVQIFALLVISFLLINGAQDTVQSFKSDRNYTEAIQTYHASAYLAARSTVSDGILKDHNYLVADSWIKLLFMRGYNYPLTRGYFSRYTDLAEPREPCPLWMISAPDSAESIKCYVGTNTDFVMINPRSDATKFTASAAFWKIYSADSIAIYHRINGPVW